MVESKLNRCLLSVHGRMIDSGISRLTRLSSGSLVSLLRWLLPPESGARERRRDCANENMTAKNHFERSILGWDASKNSVVESGSHTWHDDASMTVTVPDDGKSFVGVVGRAYGAVCFWPASALTTAEQVRKAREICAERGLDLCIYGTSVEPSPEAVAEFESTRL